MNTVINTNMAAIRTHGVYNRNNTAMNAAMTRVATGLKINSAQDNASGYAITEKMRERIRALDQANQNTQNDTAMMKTAEGALSNTVSILTTLRERALDAANDSNNDEDRTKIQTEVQELIKQIDDNADVKYNGNKLIDGSRKVTYQSTSTWFTATDLTTVFSSTGIADASSYNNRDLKITINGDTANVITGTLSSSGTLKDILDQASSAFTVTAVTATDSLGINEENEDIKAGAAGYKLVSANSGAAGNITSIKIEGTKDGTTFDDISSYFGLSSKISGVDASTSNALNFRIGEELDVTVSLGNMKAAGLGISGINLGTKAGAIAAVGTINDALETALKQQTKIGAYEQRLGYASDNLTTARENVEASASTIADSDIAKEMTNYMKFAVLSQASQYMLAQAGQNAFSVLNLLQA